MDCCCLWVASPATLTSALSTDPEDLKSVATADGDDMTTATIDYKDWQIALSRRFRAIKLWVVLRRYGAAGMRAHIRRHVWMVWWFEKAVAADERFEVVVQRHFSLVCFRLRPQLVDGEVVEAPNRELLTVVNASGRAFMTHFVVDGKFVIQLAVGGPMTEMRHVRDAWELGGHHVGAGRREQETCQGLQFGFPSPTPGGWCLQLLFLYDAPPSPLHLFLLKVLVELYL